MVTGCRRGELCALRWSDIDLERGKVAIDTALTRKLQEKSTKSDQDRRLSIDPYTVDLLLAHKKASEEQCRSLGVKLTGDSFVFSLEPDCSAPMKPDTVTQRYRRLAARNGLRSTRIHSLRHYSATELLSAGVDLKTVSGRLGHASGSTTLRFYAAWLEDADRRAAGSISTTIPMPDSLGSRAMIGQAVGILMERYRLDPDRAFSFVVRTPKPQTSNSATSPPASSKTPSTKPDKTGPSPAIHARTTSHFQFETRTARHGPSGRAALMNS